MSNEINKNNAATRPLDLNNDSNNDAAIARPEGQFMSNLSFQSNNSPEVFQLMTEAPQVDVKCSVDASLINESIDLYQVILKIHTEANLSKNNENKLAFRCQLEYCGLFTIKNLSKEQKEQALLIEAPTLLFPFARRIIATVTTDAGFPPLMLAPINFAAKYIEKNKDSLENMESGVQAG